MQKGFYNGTIFHRVIPGFMIQGGDPEGTGMGGPGYEIRGEFTANGFQNDLNHTRGVLSMARTAAPDSAGSQFFIMTEDAPHLDGQYASFGMVIDGMDIVDAIVNTKRDWHDRPREEQKMKSVTVDTQGVGVRGSGDPVTEGEDRYCTIPIRRLLSCLRTAAWIPNAADWNPFWPAMTRAQKAAVFRLPCRQTVLPCFRRTAVLPRPTARGCRQRLQLCGAASGGAAADAG